MNQSQMWLDQLLNGPNRYQAAQNILNNVNDTIRQELQKSDQLELRLLHDQIQLIDQNKELQNKLQRLRDEKTPEIQLYHQYKSLKQELDAMQKLHEKEYHEMQVLKEKHLKYVQEQHQKLKALKS